MESSCAGLSHAQRVRLLCYTLPKDDNRGDCPLASAWSIEAAGSPLAFLAKMWRIISKFMEDQQL